MHTVRRLKLKVYFLSRNDLDKVKMKKIYASTDASSGVGVFASFGEAVSQFFFSALFLALFLFGRV